MSKNAPKNAVFFVCEKCDFKCSKKSDWTRHCFTRKHERLTNASETTYKKAPFVCMCNSDYKHRQSLYKHIKYSKNIVCKDTFAQLIEEPKEDHTKLTTQLFLDMMKQNSEFQKGIIEILKQQQPATTNNNTINNNILNSNSNNKTFNLNVFLNETCKDALNLSEFIDSINVKLSDLENFGQEGYVDGISDLFLTNLNELDSHMRPIHCSDLRREILYIKTQNAWIKETDDKPLIIQAIKQLTMKNIRQISEWIKKYPDCTQSDSKKNDQYLKIVMNAMSGGTVEEQQSNINKIIKNLAKEVVINKK